MSSPTGPPSVTPSFCVDPRWLHSIRDHLDEQAIVFEAARHGMDAVLRAEGTGQLGWRLLASPTASPIDLSDMRPRSLGDVGALLELLNATGDRPWDRVWLCRVRSRSDIVATLPNSGLRYVFLDAGASAFCDVSRPDALKTLSKDTLRNVDRLRRRAEKDLGTVAIDAIGEPEGLSAAAFDRFVALEDAGWRGASGTNTSLAADVRAQAFFRDVVRRFSENGMARIDFLTIGGRDAAAQLMLRAGPTWFLLKIGYDPAFKDVGPGGILLKHFLEETAADPEILEVNLTTNPAWASRWHFQTEPVHNVLIYNSTWRGRILYAGRAVKEFAKKLRDASQNRRQNPAT